MKTEQLSHENTQTEAPLLPFVLVCDGLSSPANAGSLFRLADALGIAHLYFCNSSINFESTRLKRTARSSEKAIKFSEDEDIAALLSTLSTEGYTILGLELTTTSQPLSEFAAHNFEKIALVLGNERHGISDAILNLTNYSIYIPMRGKNSSMNVSQAAAIAAYQLINSPKYGK
ncbi:SpoU rRNA methylase family protein [Leeuwenhoekiella aestuarii]|uniref:SpoU rRNA methylase family protein n=1 Tax=Leeuwenhoekiella aestuarii TaxID=2249426 RepID=A0A4V1KPI8_9FLAO|nr:TrmH family RNA methyltransferase [Leeuwenhoekiella aestuarii]RXG15703.1 SpoU rRNA methylase family protein [Leeuwenhoekiella aestuarii]RXG17188.1 SpoU rRNA methylase family protein [Leeuwenhoekiella aestuarii]